MRLDVGPQTDAMLVEVTLVSVQIILETVQVQHEKRGVQIFRKHRVVLSVSSDRRNQRRSNDRVG